MFQTITKIQNYKVSREVSQKHEIFLADGNVCCVDASVHIRTSLNVTTSFVIWSRPTNTCTNCCSYEKRQIGKYYVRDLELSIVYLCTGCIYEGTTNIQLNTIAKHVWSANPSKLPVIPGQIMLLYHSLTLYYIRVIYTRCKISQIFNYTFNYFAIYMILHCIWFLYTIILYSQIRNEICSHGFIMVDLNSNLSCFIFCQITLYFWFIDLILILSSC